MTGVKEERGEGEEERNEKVKEMKGRKERI